MVLPYNGGLGPPNGQTHESDVAALIHRDYQQTRLRSLLELWREKEQKYYKKMKIIKLRFHPKRLTVECRISRGQAPQEQCGVKGLVQGSNSCADPIVATPGLEPPTFQVQIMNLSR